MKRKESFSGGQPWFYSLWLDSFLILFPSFFAVGFVWIFRKNFDLTTSIPLWLWGSIIVGVDVAHVYSTVFRTYLNPAEWKENRLLLLVVPMICWGAGVFLYTISDLLFWRVLAYVAVFHFIRQQYGFMRLYSRQEGEMWRKWRWIDQGMIYSAAVYPLLYWHTHLPRNFHWFVDGDFFSGVPLTCEWIGKWIYGAIASLYISKEILYFVRSGFLNIPKQLICLGTALSWYMGIVTFNGDIAFTMINVISHGLPYIGLVWIAGRRESKRRDGRFNSIFQLQALPLFLGLLYLLAYLEEGLWDGWIWREHLEFFKGFESLAKIEDPVVLSCLVPFLAAPQFTHYILDGFIWKIRKNRSQWLST